MKPMTIILIGALIAILGGVIGAIGTWKHNKSSSDKSTRIEEGVNKGVSIGETTNSELLHLRKENQDLINQSNGLTQKIDTQSKTIDELRRENIELYSKLATSSLEIYNNLTGGDSYCYCLFIVPLSNPSKDIGHISFTLGEKSKSPLRNINARIVDLNSFNTKQTIFENTFKNVILEKIELEEYVTLPDKFNLDKEKGVNLNIFFSANNGFFEQLLRMRFINNEWVSATIVKRNEQTIYEKIDKNYPEKDVAKIFK
jgi:hypothetical protein